MTHQFRTMHDAILMPGRVLHMSSMGRRGLLKDATWSLLRCAPRIGVGTLLLDDPQLTARLVPGPSPQPLVLDSNLRTPLTSALVTQAETGTANRKPLTILTTKSESASESNGSKDKWARAKALDQRGVFILEVPSADGRVSLEDALCRIKEDLGCHSVMVEGGMAVIASFLARPELVSNLVVTVSPKVLGGYGPSAELVKGKGEPQSLLSMQKMQSCPVGDDVVLYGSPSVPYLNGKNGASRYKAELIRTQYKQSSHLVTFLSPFALDINFALLGRFNWMLGFDFLKLLRKVYSASWWVFSLRSSKYWQNCQSNVSHRDCRKGMAIHILWRGFRAAAECGSRQCPRMSFCVSTPLGLILTWHRQLSRSVT